MEKIFAIFCCLQPSMKQQSTKRFKLSLKSTDTMDGQAATSFCSKTFIQIDPVSRSALTFLFLLTYFKEEGTKGPSSFYWVYKGRKKGWLRLLWKGILFQTLSCGFESCWFQIWSDFNSYPSLVRAHRINRHAAYFKAAYN